LRKALLEWAEPPFGDSEAAFLFRAWMHALDDLVNWSDYDEESGLIRKVSVSVMLAQLIRKRLAVIRRIGNSRVAWAQEIFH